jgi:hypothetical protein
MSWIALGANSIEFLASLLTFFGEIFDKSFVGYNAQGQPVNLAWRKSYLWLSIWSTTWGITGIQNFVISSVLGVCMPKIYAAVAMWGYIVSGSVGLIMSIVTIALGYDFNA